MSTILFCWQLGAGMDHIMRAKRLAERLLARGHRVVLAFNNLSGTGRAFAGLDVEYYSAPLKNDGRMRFPVTVSFAHLLGNNGFGDYDELFAIASAWRNLFLRIKPDVALFDHSPAALFAARGLGFKTAVYGTGFFCPPDQSPLPVIIFPEGAKPKMELVIADEQNLLGISNRVLEHWKAPILSRLAGIYYDADENILTTFPELDHFGERPGERYWGPIMGAGGAAPEWPEGAQPKIFAYLKPFPGLADLLAALRGRAVRTIVVCDGITAALQKAYACPTLRFENRRLDPSRFNEECDVAVINANHGTASGLLLKGKPLIQIPLFPEQEMFAGAVVRMSAGVMLKPRKGQLLFEKAIEAVLEQPQFRQGAERFAARHASFDPEAALDGICERVIALTTH